MGKRKKVNYELIAKDSPAGELMYPLLSELLTLVMNHYTLCGHTRVFTPVYERIQRLQRASRPRRRKVRSRR